MSILRPAILLFTLALVIGCTSRPKTQEKPTTPVAAPESIKVISMEEIQQALDMPSDALGFSEKTFNSCALPKELRTTPTCESQTFSIIRFQVVCRDTTGTTQTSVTSANIRPMTTPSIEWVVGANRGKTSTDGSGFGTALILSKSSVSKKRFILKFHQKALGLTAEEVSKIVVPDNWCNKKS